MNARRLLMDAGNSRLKTVVVEQGVWQTPASTDYADLDRLLPLLLAGTRCAIASVASARHESQISDLLASRDIAPVWLRTDARFADLSNTYDDPQQLGVDRWMSLIGARQRSPRACLVVSLGTAITIDALSADGVMLGGVIAPGLRMMRQALQQGTARITAADGAVQAFPRNTADAVQSGCIAAACGAIEQQFARLSAVSHGVPHCILSGGDAAQLLPHLPMAVEHVPTLVLEGIDRVTREEWPL